MGILREVIDALIVDSGLPTEDKIGFTKVRAADGSDRRIYVATTKMVRRIDLSGFLPPRHVAISNVTPELRQAKKLSAGVKAQIDFSRPTAEILDAIRFALDILAGKVVAEAVATKRGSRRPPLALTGYIEPTERASALRFFTGVAVAALAADGGESETTTHLNYILDKCIWAVTTCSDLHKYNTRYLSASVRDLVLEWAACAAAGRKFSRSEYRNTDFALFKKLVRHEHVVPREALRSLLRTSQQSAVERVLRGAHACLVTIKESRALDRASGSAWERYAAKEIRVWDRARGDWLDMPPFVGT